MIFILKYKFPPMDETQDGQTIDNLRISHNASGMGANIRVLVT